MKLKELVSKDLIKLNVSVETEEELFNLISKDLYDKGYVTEKYLEGIIEREKNFPTGLITANGNIAIPHSDMEYIKKPFVYIVRTKNELDVIQMGDNAKMKVNTFYFLGINQPTGQVELLSELMELYMNKEKVKDLTLLTSKEDIVAYFTK